MNTQLNLTNDHKELLDLGNVYYDGATKYYYLPYVFMELEDGSFEMTLLENISQKVVDRLL